MSNGNNPNQGGAQAAAPVAPAADQETSVARLPPWKGNGKDQTTVDLWIDQVDRMATQKGWSNARTAAAVCDALRENAARWMAVQKANASKKAMLNDWATLKEALKKRFTDSLTAAQKQSFVKGLQQASNESVQDFFDRVALGLSKVHENHRDGLTGAEVEGQRKGYDKSFDITLGTLFVSGLKHDIREYVECNMADDKTDSESLLELAVKCEASKGHGAKSASLKLAAIDDEYSPNDEVKRLNDELAALKTRMNTFTAGSGQTGRGRGRGRQNTPLPAFEDRKTWFFCYRCKQHGLHISRECKLTDDEVKKLTPQQRYPVPTGTPTDRQFPNGM